MSAPYKTNLRDNPKPSTKEPLYLKTLKRLVVRKDQVVNVRSHGRPAWVH